VVDEERPLESSYHSSNLPSKIGPSLYLTSEYILKAFHRKKTISNLIPILKKLQILFLCIFPARCPFGVSNEMEFSKGADTKASKEVYIPL